MLQEARNQRVAGSVTLERCQAQSVAWSASHRRVPLLRLVLARQSAAPSPALQIQAPLGFKRQHYFHNSDLKETRNRRRNAPQRLVNRVKRLSF